MKQIQWVMSRMSDLIVVMTILLVISISLIQQQRQFASARSIMADFKLDDTLPSIQAGHILYCLKNIKITNTTHPTGFVPSIGKRSLLDVDSDQVFMQGMLVTHTTSQDSTMSNAIIALPIDTIKNYTNGETITTDKNRWWVNLNGHLTFGTTGIININKNLGRGTMLISTDQSAFFAGNSFDLAHHDK